MWDRTKAYRVLADSNLDWGRGGRYVARYLRAHPEVSLGPDRQRHGTLLVSVNNYVGWPGMSSFGGFERTSNRSATYSHLLVRVTPEALRRVTDPLPPDHGDKVN